MKTIGKKLLRSVALCAVGLVLAAALFRVGCTAGVVFRKYYVDTLAMRFIDWKYTDALAKYTDSFWISQVQPSGDYNNLYVLVYPQLTPELENILRSHFADRWVIYAEADGLYE